jgi:hypothetical protein
MNIAFGMTMNNLIQIELFIGTLGLSLFVLRGSLPRRLPL